MTRYYAEEVRFDGKPKRVIYEQEPSERTSDGAKRRFIVAPTKMNAGEATRTINQAARHYGSRAIFRNS